MTGDLAWLAWFIPVCILASVVGGVGAWFYLHHGESKNPSQLDCGCPRDARPGVGCMRCGRTACLDHREHEYAAKMSEMRRP